MNERLFSDLNLSKPVLKAIDDLGFTMATQVQYEAIPHMLDGKDIIGRSATGTGKTAAFSIPIIEKINDEVNHPKALIISPTRELAMQICDEIKKFAKYKKNIKVTPVYGGESITNQIRALKFSNVIVGTPGRILDHIDRKTIKLNNIETVVLDEADEMLNMGFLDDINAILTKVPEERQTVLFSATMPKAIMKISEDFLVEPVLVAADSGKRSLESIEQFFYQVPQSQKKQAINLILQQYSTKRTVIFSNTKKMVDELDEYLNENGFRSVGLHGDMRQGARTQVMRNFKNGKLNVLVATDVAARGIDVEDVELVINFDIPQEMEYYTHRIGRTGRAGKKGLSVTLVTNKQQLKRLYEIKQDTNAVLTEKSLPSVDDILLLKADRISSKVVNAINDESYIKWLAIVESIKEMNIEYTPEKIAAACINLITGKDKKQIPQIENVSFSNNDKRRREKSGTKSPIKDKTKIFVDLGRSKKIAPNFLLGAIVEATGLDANEIGKIDIFEHHTTIELSKNNSKIVLNQMEKYKVRGMLCHFTKECKITKNNEKSNDYHKFNYDKSVAKKKKTN